ncbi:MAG: restriction endonuclease subunit S [bacterium]|nr:restriction endonuclease subunit S [bacterium]
MIDGLRDEHRQAILDILSSHPGVDRAVLFGSRAMGTFTAESDVDICLYGESLTLTDHAKLAAKMEALPVPQRVDLLLHRAIEDRALLGHIRREGRVLFERRSMVSEWRDMPFSEAVTVNPRVRLVRGSEYPFVDMQAVSAGSRSACATTRRPFNGGGSRFAVGDTLLARITPCLENGKIARYCADSDSVAHGSTEFIVIRGRDAITETDYAYYLTKWEGVRGFAINQMTGTSGRQRVPTEAFDHLLVPIPPLSEQRAIAHILGTIDDKIDLNRRMNDTLDVMARALFKSWFVDFDPVRANADGRETGLPKSLANLFPDSFEESEVGEIPLGWEPGTLADLAVLNPESWSKETRPILVDYVDLSNTKWGRIESVTTYAREDAPGRAQRVLRRGDSVVGTVRPGNGSYALIAADGLTGSTGFAVLRPTKDECTEFVYCAATSAANIEALSRLADGGAYPAVRPEVVAATQIVVPRTEVLVAFARIAGPLLGKWAQNERQSLALATMRDALLPKLVSGELRLNGDGGMRFMEVE